MNLKYFRCVWINKLKLSNFIKNRISNALNCVVQIEKQKINSTKVLTIHFLWRGITLKEKKTVTRNTISIMKIARFIKSTEYFQRYSNCGCECVYAMWLTRSNICIVRKIPSHYTRCYNNYYAHLTISMLMEQKIIFDGRQPQYAHHAYCILVMSFMLWWFPFSCFKSRYTPCM